MSRYGSSTTTTFPRRGVRTIHISNPAGRWNHAKRFAGGCTSPTTGQDRTRRTEIGRSKAVAKSTAGGSRAIEGAGEAAESGRPLMSLPASLISADAMQVGYRDHYLHATRVVSAGPDRVVLVQRSSSLVLGPESGWDSEAAFFEAAWRSIDGGAEWFHIASTCGIDDHLRRQTSTFPNVRLANERLRRCGDEVGLPHGPNRMTLVKNIDRLRPRPDLKIDRQARVLIADFGGDFEALVVENVGERQLTIHLRGTAAADLFGLAHSLWSECPALTGADLMAFQSTSRRARCPQGT
jgi:hypothetical protein